MIALLAGQAAALSCMRPDPIVAFQRAAESTDEYFVLYGTLDFDASLLPDAVDSQQRHHAPIPAMFRGNGLSKTGFDQRFDAPVVLQPFCAGPWCGQTTPHQPALIFARVVDDQVLIELGPCVDLLFAVPTLADLQKMVQCMNGNC